MPGRAIRGNVFSNIVDGLETRTYSISSQGNLGSVKCNNMGKPLVKIIRPF